MKMLLLPGDGIGPEVIDEARRIIAVLNTGHGLGLEVESAEIGGASIEAHGVPLAPHVLAQAKASHAVLMGAVGGPQWKDVAYHLRPEQGLLDLRKGLGLFANLRPAVCFGALADASSLKREVIEGLDILIVRELIGGVYFGEPRGIEELPDGTRRGFNTQSYSTGEIERVARTAFTLARQRQGRVCSVEKANVMESGVLWRETVTALHAAEFSDIELSHMYADNCAMQLVRHPRQFDVILTDNLFGDILSDEAAMLTGSLGMLPSAALGAPGQPGLFEPIHGSAPDIAGKGVANPCAAILSLAMALRYQLERPDLADLVEKAVSDCLADGYRTADLAGGPDTRQVGTQGMGEAIAARLAG
ncbi:MAG: 3-isopropylmalate dehydrogenase [Caulobacterales bacterium]|uniref:3-isopropylmalate dehydrogenase n=1 Tax=Glycocaulis sp. TaxID=1969725 RepID=UPI003F9ECC2C